MWRTGFGVPYAHTLSIDNPMKSHDPRPAVARVHRMFEGKRGGVEVDCADIANELRSALKQHPSRMGRSRPAVDVRQACDVLAGMLVALRGLQHAFYDNDLRTDGHKTLAAPARFALGSMDGKWRFAELTRVMRSSFMLCCTLDEAEAVRQRMALFPAVRTVRTRRDIRKVRATDGPGDETLKKITHEQAETLRWSLCVDGSAHARVRAKLRPTDKCIQPEYKDPRNRQDAQVAWFLPRPRGSGEAWA
jgi:type I restriction enzyme R subunit